MSKYGIIRAGDLERAVKSGGVIIDVRSKEEHDERSLGLSHCHIPMGEISIETLRQIPSLKDDTNIYILCLGGKRAAIVAASLVNMGFSSVHVVDGGLMSCESCGYQIINNK